MVFLPREPREHFGHDRAFAEFRSHSLLGHRKAEDDVGWFLEEYERHAENGLTTLYATVEVELVLGLPDSEFQPPFWNVAFEQEPVLAWVAPFKLLIDRLDHVE